MKNEFCAKMILQWFESEQSIRKALSNDKLTGSRRQGVIQLCAETDRDNARMLKSMIFHHGWPTISLVGEEAAYAACMIIRHADHDVTFQERCLCRMIEQPESEVPEVEIAFLFDRICVNRKQPQFFGTQFMENNFGAYGPRPIYLFEQIDERRAQIGLEPLEEYRQHLIKKYSIASP